VPLPGLICDTFPVRPRSCARSREASPNSEIAGALSEATVKTHATHVRNKLGLRDRVQAIVLAYEPGLIVPGADHR
jgi:hypothetical protein